MGHVESCKQAIAINPNYAQAYNNLGQIYQELKKSDAAVANYDKAIHLQPDFAEAYCLRGDALTELKQLDAAIESYNKAIAIKPAFVEAFCNRGKALLACMLLDAAVDSFNQAIAAKPDSAEVFSNRGNAQQGLNQLSDAINSYNTAIALKPDWAEAYWNKAIALLLTGELQAGWELYEWRWKTQKAGSKAHNFVQPLWLGTESLVDKTILLHSEQGYGDTIQFCRYATAVLALGAQVVLEAPLSLLPLLQGLDDAIVLVEKGKQLPDFDFHCPLLSLPFAFKTKLDTIPALPAYFHSDKEKVRLWSNRLGPKTTPRIGLVWSGSTVHKNDHNRSLTLAQLVEHLPKSYRYICLQKEQREVDKAALQAHPHVEFYGNELNDFVDTAALCDLMDVIISVDTSVAHLAGALGKQTWILLPFSPDWRWLLNRTDSPWYPSVRLYRQDTIGDWSTILQRIKSDLQKHPVLSN
jgi:tetratricopeptide (TPR) repeat protein